jgi:hypothetical protein
MSVALVTMATSNRIHLLALALDPLVLRNRTVD